MTSLEQAMCGVCQRLFESDEATSALLVCRKCACIYHGPCAATTSGCISPACWASNDQGPGLLVPWAEAHAASTTRGPLGSPANQSGADYLPDSLQPEFDAEDGLHDEFPVARASERTSLPLRIKTGRFEDEHLVLESPQGDIRFGYAEVSLLCLGLIEEEIGDARPTRSGLRKVMRSVLFGEKEEGREQKRPTRETYLLDLFVGNNPTPHRFESTSVNYRSFLGASSALVTTRNFLMLAARLVRQCADARLDASMIGYLLGQRERIRHYGSVYDFELDTFHSRENLANLLPRSELRLPERLFFEEGGQPHYSSAAAISETTEP